MKTLREMMDLIESAQHPKTWHDVDPKLGQQVDQMSQAEKVNKGLAHPDTLNKEQVYKVVALDKGNALKKPAKMKVKASSIEDLFGRLSANDWYPLEINGVEVVAGKRLKQGVAEGSTPPGSPAWQDGYRAGIKDTTNKKPVGSYAYCDGWKAAKKHLSNKQKQQGVAEGTVYPNAQVIKSKNGKPVGEIYQDGNTWGCFHYRADRGADFLDSREDAIAELKLIHQENGRKTPDYTIKGEVEEGQIEEASPEAVAKIDELTRN